MKEKKDRAQSSAFRTSRHVRATVRGKRREDESEAQAGV